MADFQTINTQEEFDARIKARLARERERWEKDSGMADLRQERDDAVAAADRVRSEAGGKVTRREAEMILKSKGVTDAARISRILRLTDLEGIPVGDDYAPDADALERRMGALKKDIPEVFGEGAAYFQGEGYGAAPGADSRTGGGTTGGGLTREQVASMTPEQIMENRAEVDAVLAGE